MTQSGLRTRLLSNDEQGEDSSIAPQQDAFATAKVFQGTKPALKNWRISTFDAAQEEELPKSETVDFAEEEMARIRSSHQDDFDVATPKWLEIIQYVSIFFSVAWLTYNAIFLASIPGGFAAVLASPASIGNSLSAILAPIALVWLCVTTWQRKSDAHLYAEALRRELQRLLFPTEEQSRAVNRDIQLLVQQAVEISASSRAALKAIQRARQGLRAEIRDFSGVSQKTEFHIDRLAETLNKRAEDLVKLTDQIEQRSKNISEEVKTGVEVWSEISAEALDKVNELQTSFDKQTQVFEVRTQKLTDAGSKLTAETGKLGERFEDGFSKLNDLGVRSVQSFERITTELEKFDSLSEGIFTRSETIEQNLDRQAESMKRAASDLGARVTELDLIGTTASDKLGEALSMALSGSDSIVSAVRRAREQLEKAAVETTRQADELMAETDRRVGILSETTTGRLEQISELLSGFDDRQKTISTVIDKLAEQNENVSVVTETALDRLTSAVHLLDQSALTLDIKSSKPVTEIRDATEHLSHQVERIHESLQAGVTEIDANTTKARAAADEIARSLKQHVYDLAQMSGQVNTQSRTLNSQFDEQKEKISSFIESTSSRINEFETVLERQIGDFTGSVKLIETDIEKLGSQLQDKGLKAVRDTAACAESFKAIENNIVDRLENLTAQTAQTQILIEDYEGGIRRSAEAIMPLYEKIASGAEDADNRIDRLRDSTEASTQDIFARMEELNRELESQIARLNSEVENSERGMSSLSGDIRNSVSTIEQSAEQATEKLKLLHNGLQGRTEDLQILADQAELRINSLQKTFDVNTSEINSALSQATSKLEDATTQFEKSAETIDQRAETSSRKIESLGSMFIEEGHRLALTGEQTLHKTARILNAIQEESSRATAKTEENLDGLRRSTDTLSVRAREIEEYTKAAIVNTQSYSDGLRNQVRIIADTSAEVVDTMGDCLNNLQTQVEDASRQSEKVVEKVEKARQSLGRESDRFETISRKITDTADEAAGKFIRHSASVLKSAEDISGHAERIRDLQIRSSREAFLSSAKFVIESLHSLSVDVSRHLEDDVDERSWRAYQKGDVAVFTRRLVHIADDVPMERVRRKFAEDSEFRNYSQRYIRQFEELFESAQNNDHGELLSSIFISSDVGKLYRLLCDISGRTAKIN